MKLIVIIQIMPWLGAQDNTDDSGQEEPCYQTMDDPDYVDYRAEASAHYKLRHQFFQKAADAYRRGMRSLASFYSQQGHLHTEKLKEANGRAADKIMQSRYWLEWNILGDVLLVFFMAFALI